MGEMATAITTASIDPSTTAPSIPTSPSAMVVAGSAPRARRTVSSSVASRKRRAMACVAMSNTARRATAPNIPSAMAIGFTARSAFAATGAVACKVSCVPGGTK